MTDKAKKIIARERLFWILISVPIIIGLIYVGVVFVWPIILFFKSGGLNMRAR